MEWIYENLASLILLFCVVLLLSALVFGLWRSKKRKPSSCAGGCLNCPYGSGCHGKESEK